MAARWLGPLAQGGPEVGTTGRTGEREGLIARGRCEVDESCLQRLGVCMGCMSLLFAVAALLAYEAATSEPIEASAAQLLHLATATSTSTSTTTITTTTTTPAPPFITFVTAETRGDPLVKNVLGFPEHFTDRLINIGTGHKWHDYKTKVALLAEWLRTRAEEEARKDVAKEGPELIAFIDGSDVFWGGCDPDYFLRSYQQIVNGSGARIVFSAEVVCGEQDCNAVPDVPAWANEIGGKDLNSGFWGKFAIGCKGTWNDQCAAKRDCGFWAPCSEPPAVKFLNSGFIMGPVQELKDMLDWTIGHYDNTSVWGDQSAFAVYWLQNQANVTLDYTGALALSLSDMSHELMQAHKEEGVVRNGAFGQVQCLIHGNGRGIFFMKHVLKVLTGKEFEDIRGW